jgi:hypothetical protein
MNKSQTTKQGESSPQKPRKIQEIFDAVIDARIYGIGICQCDYMCNALSQAERKGIITKKEKTRATQSINTYLEKLTKEPDCYGFVTLKRALKFSGLPFDRLSRLAIYQNWNKRPAPKTRTKSS